MTAEFDPDGRPINAEALAALPGHVKPSRGELFIGGPKDGQRLTILNGNTAVVMGVHKPDGVGVEIERHTYRVERLAVGTEPIVRIWASETLTLREAMLLLARNYASAAVRANVATLLRKVAYRLLPFCTDSTARAAYVALCDMIKDFEP